MGLFSDGEMDAVGPFDVVDVGGVGFEGESCVLLEFISKMVETAYVLVEWKRNEA